jgi:hypothetical protein
VVPSVMSACSENGRLCRESMHQVLLQIRQNSYRNIQAVKETVSQWKNPSSLASCRPGMSAVE